MWDRACRPQSRRRITRWFSVAPSTRRSSTTFLSGLSRAPLHLRHPCRAGLCFYQLHYPGRTRRSSVPPLLHEQDVEIGYAYTSFKWGNNAKFNAGVTVVVVSLRPISNAPIYFHEDIRTNVSQTNGYLLDAPCVYVGPRPRPLSSELPKK